MTSRLAASAHAVALALALGSCGPTPPPTPDAAVPPLPGTYENVTMIFTRTCSFSSCHGGLASGAGRLNFTTSIAAGTLVADLEEPACQYGLMPLVTPGDPMNSWLYLKIAGPHTGMSVDFTPDPSWDHGGLVRNGSGRYPSSTCPLTASGQITFGSIMPMGTAGLAAGQAETIRLWIEAGAPGPT